MCTLNSLPAASWPSLSLSTTSGSPAIARNVGSQSWWLTISLDTTPAAIRPGQRTSIGTRNAPSQLVFFSLRKGVIPPSGQLFMCGPLSVVYMTNVSSAMPSSSSRSSSSPTLRSWSIIVSWYGDCHGPAWPRLSGLVCVPEVHVRGVDPAEERLAGLVLPPDPVLRRGDELVVAGLHPLLGQRAGVLDPLLADPAPARVLGVVVGVRRPAVQHAARPEPVPEVRVLLVVRVVRLLRLLLRVEVVEVAVELVEAVHRRQELVPVAEVVLAELARRVAVVLQQLGDGRVLRPAGRASRPGRRPSSGRCGSRSAR